MSRITKVTLPESAVRPDLKQSNPFKIGDRVRMKLEHMRGGVEQQKLWTGVVASVPDTGPVIKLGTHVLGNEMGVDLDGGGRGVADIDHWEAV